MKAYTVYQPYAYATVAGLKHYETRPRRTNIRGRVAVHAAKKTRGVPAFSKKESCRRSKRRYQNIKGLGIGLHTLITAR